MTRRVRALYCEALREGGLLVIVFASLDSAFEVTCVNRHLIASLLPAEPEDMIGPESESAADRCFNALK